jgi:hypothetical protein
MKWRLHVHVDPGLHWYWVRRPLMGRMLGDNDGNGVGYWLCLYILGHRADIVLTRGDTCW